MSEAVNDESQAATVGRPVALTDGEAWGDVPLAVAILDDRKKIVCHENLDAWLTLFHAKQYLLGKATNRR